MSRAGSTDTRILRWLGDVEQDVRYAVRTLRRAPGFTLVAVLTLAIGIGATTAIYSVVNAILLRPLPLADADRLVRIAENIPRREAGLPPFQRGVTYQQFLEWRARTTTLSDLIVVSTSIGLVKTADGTARLWGTTISTSAFETLGARAAVGRTFVSTDDKDPSVVVLGFATWQRLFHADPAIVGRTLPFLSATGAPRLFTIVGVMPADFELPGEEPEFYRPLVVDAASKGPGRVTLIGRLGPGVTLDGALQEAGVIGAAVADAPSADAPPLHGPRFDVQPLKDRAVQDVRPALRLLLVMVGVVLLVVCGNIANLLLARGTSRQRELAVRSAIGATRFRIVRQILTECLVIAIAGGALGALVGAAGVALVKMLASVDAPGIFRLSLGVSILPRVNEIRIDAAVFAVAIGTAALASLAFGVLPALHLSRPNNVGAMGIRGGGSSRGGSRIRAALVVGQLVMATVSLVSAGLIVRSFVKLSHVDRGYDPANVLAFQLVFPPDYTIPRKVETIESLLERLRAMPNVRAAGFTRAGMQIGEQITIGTFVPQRRTLAEMRAYTVRPSLRPVSRGYLTAMGVPVLDGRDLDETDEATPAIVISRSVARQFGFSGHVGSTVDWYVRDGPPVPLRVVGIVEDLRNTSPAREPYPEVFLEYRALLSLQQRWGEAPIWQHERALGLLSFAIRTRADPAAAVPAVEQIIRSVDPNAGIDSILPMDRLVASSVARSRFYAVMFAVFAGVAGLLALIGIYGVLAYAVTERSHEIGVRMALGAQRLHVLTLVIRQGLILTAIGVSLGLLGATAGTRILQGMLFGVTPVDTGTFVVVSLTFCVVAALASYVPAHRATKVDPMLVLRRD